MGGSYAVTTDDEPAFDPRPVKVGDVLWSVFWHHEQFDFDEPTIFCATVEKVEQVAMRKYRDRVGADQIEEEWIIEFDKIGPRSFHVNPMSPPFYTPYFWTSREAVEENVRSTMQAVVDEAEEELVKAQEKLSHAKELVTGPLKFDPDFG